VKPLQKSEVMSNLTNLGHTFIVPSSPTLAQSNQTLFTHFLTSSVYCYSLTLDNGIKYEQNSLVKNISKMISGVRIIGIISHNALSGTSQVLEDRQCIDVAVWDFLAYNDRY